MAPSHQKEKTGKVTTQVDKSEHFGGKVVGSYLRLSRHSMSLCVCFFNIRIEMGPVNSSDSDLPVNSITQGLPGCLLARPEPWPCLNS